MAVVILDFDVGLLLMIGGKGGSLPRLGQSPRSRSSSSL